MPLFNPNRTSRNNDVKKQFGQTNTKATSKLFRMTSFAKTKAKKAVLLLKNFSKTNNSSSGNKKIRESLNQNSVGVSQGDPSIEPKKELLEQDPKLKSDSLVGAPSSPPVHPETGPPITDVGFNPFTELEGLMKDSASAVTTERGKPRKSIGRRKLVDKMDTLVRQCIQSNINVSDGDIKNLTDFVETMKGLSQQPTKFNKLLTNIHRLNINGYKQKFSENLNSIRPPSIFDRPRPENENVYFRKLSETSKAMPLVIEHMRGKDFIIDYLGNPDPEVKSPNHELQVMKGILIKRNPDFLAGIEEFKGKDEDFAEELSRAILTIPNTYQRMDEGLTNTLNEEEKDFMAFIDKKHDEQAFDDLMENLEDAYYTAYYFLDVATKGPQLDRSEQKDLQERFKNYFRIVDELRVFKKLDFEKSCFDLEDIEEMYVADFYDADDLEYHNSLFPTEKEEKEKVMKTIKKDATKKRQAKVDKARENMKTRKAYYNTLDEHLSNKVDALRNFILNPPDERRDGIEKAFGKIKAKRFYY